MGYKEERREARLKADLADLYSQRRYLQKELFSFRAGSAQFNSCKEHINRIDNLIYVASHRLEALDA